MGLHYVFDYVGYEAKFLETFISLIDRFCASCHTNEDVEGDCSKCPVGNLVYSAKDYILNAYESENREKEAEILREVKEEIEDIEPEPLFHRNFIWSEERSDRLEELRKLSKDLKFVKDYALNSFLLKEGIEEEVSEQAFKKIEKERDEILENLKGEEDD